MLAERTARKLTALSYVPQGRGADGWGWAEYYSACSLPLSSPMGAPRELCRRDLRSLLPQALSCTSTFLPLISTIAEP